ncbi:bis(5'-nucleosyl)-tetraphosphatase PrpE [Bacillus solitudinis]|uniref:bis(5'-nucleosyl)-tetraphosphatase PrpE n=1 Tax=Bacillus solitudinis TaxID=2014074 RepID=UPI000C2433DE|nr:bis(5'-nucleosyl)-tetraphosphatase PrpE [Bacillus solitudinis]
MKIDCIGDIHGCYDELLLLLYKLGYERKGELYFHHEGRKLTFVGDLTDRGPKSLAVIDLVSELVKTDLAYYVPGNHCDKLYRYFQGRNVQQKHGLETTVAELNALDNRSYKKVKAAFVNLVNASPLYHNLDEGKLVVAHAGIREQDIGKVNKRIKTFVLYGDISGETNSDGTPVRRDWAQHYQGDTWVVYGHTPVKAARFINNTVNIDTGCVFGGHLTALRYPEIKTISVPSSMPFVEEKFRSFPS